MMIAEMLGISLLEFVLVLITTSVVLVAGCLLWIARQQDKGNPG